MLPFPEDTRSGALLHWPKGGIYPLLPYGNRIRDGRLAFRGQVHELPAHPDAAPHTLPGPAHRAPWQVTQRGPAQATWSIEVEAGPEWPWRYAASIAVRLFPTSLELELELANRDAEPMPAGLGLHPYFVFGPQDTLTFQAETDWPVTADFLAGPPRPAAPDFAVPTELPRGTMTLYRSGWTGSCVLRREREYDFEMRASPVFDHFVAHHPDSAPYICFEPTTHAPDGFNLAESGVTGVGRSALEPGETLRGTARIAVASPSLQAELP